MCPFSQVILAEMMTKIGKPCPTDWTHLMAWGAAALKRKTTRNLVAKLAIQSCIYGIWRERNSRVHDSFAPTCTMMDIKYMLVGLPSKPLYVAAVTYLQ